MRLLVADSLLQSACVGLRLRNVDRETLPPAEENEGSLTIGTVEYIPEGSVVVVTSGKKMQVVCVQSREQSLTVFADNLEAHGEEITSERPEGA